MSDGGVSVRKLVVDSSGIGPAIQARAEFARDCELAEVCVRAPVNYRRGLRWRVYGYVRVGERIVRK